MGSAVDAFWGAADSWICNRHTELAEPLRETVLQKEGYAAVQHYCETLLAVSSVAERFGHTGTERTAWEFYEHWKFYTLGAFDFEIPWVCAPRGPLPDKLVETWLAGAAHASDWLSVANDPMLTISLRPWRRQRHGHSAWAGLSEVATSYLRRADPIERLEVPPTFRWTFGIEVDDEIEVEPIRYSISEADLDQAAVEALVVRMSATLGGTPTSQWAELLNAA